jgi:putative tryptophan/tyrosine transport system substrate-binding protein
MKFGTPQRREFVALLGAAAAWPLTVQAQQPAMPMIGLLAPASATQVEIINAVRQGLEEAGFVEGQNVIIQTAFAEGQFDRLPNLVADLVRRHVTVVTALGVAAAVAAKRATTTIPVVFYMGEDPVGLGLVPSFNHPGGNLTGVATLSSEVMAKRLELLHEIAPRADTFAALINPKNPSAAISAKEAQNAAHALGKSIYIVHASAESELEPAFATIAQLRAGGLLIAPDGLFIAYAAQVAALSLRHAIPTSHERRAFPDAGGLMSYGASQADGIRLAGVYTGRILKGEKPAEMPVTQPTKFELVINRKTANALALTIPQTLLVAADEVIE